MLAQLALRAGAVVTRDELEREFWRGTLAFNLAFAFRRAWTDTSVETLERALDPTTTGVALNGVIPQTH